MPDYLKTAGGLVPLTRHIKAPPWDRWVTLPEQPGPHTLHYAGGRLYVGAGDWTANLGPTDVVSVGLDGEVRVDLADVPTDALHCFREIDGAVYAPYTDPRGPDRGGYVTNAGGEWHAVEFTSPLMVHCFDMGATSHGLWMTGSAHREDDTTIPVVLLSTDDGATWTEVHAGSRGPSARYFGLWAEGDAVFVRRDSVPPVFTSSDGGQTWSEVDRPDLHPALSSWGYRRPHYLRTPDPTPYEQVLRNWTIALPPGGAHPTVVGEHAYVVAPDGDAWSIYRRPAPPRET